MTKLSIIIPAYNAEPYIHELLDCLEKQLIFRTDVQVIVVDDGSTPSLKINRKWVEFYRNAKNKGISYTRNKGLKKAKGDCIHFVDADDLLADNYIEYVLNLIDTKDFDYIDLSWKSLKGGAQFDLKLNSETDRLPNPSASTRIFKRSFIGDHTFNEKKDAAEDEEFTRQLDIKNGKSIAATEYMYFYRTYVANSNSKRFINGECETSRIAYFINHVTSDMTDLVEQIKKDYEKNEVYLLTYQNDIPELEKCCRLLCPPERVRVFEAKGEPNNFISIIQRPIKADIVIWTKQTFPFGGIETFIYNFCANMSNKYDIVVLYEQMEQVHINRLSKFVRVVKNVPETNITCDTLLINRIGDALPKTVKYKKSIQMSHCLKQQASWHIPQFRDAIVCVSKASKDSFGEEAKDATVIHNLTVKSENKPMLIFVSSSRIGASDKGDNDKRMIRLANLMNEKKMRFVWLYFGDKMMHNAPEHMVYMGYDVDIAPYIKKADYVVQLSDKEAYCYAMLEALVNGTPVIATPLAQNTEMGIEDNKNGYIVPFDFDESFDVEKFYNIPEVDFQNENEEIIKQWENLIKTTKPKSFNGKGATYIKARVTYQDLQMGRVVTEGEEIAMSAERAKELYDKGLVEIIKM